MSQIRLVSHIGMPELEDQLEEQIQFAVYSSEIDWGFVDEMRKLLEGDAELPNKEIALDVLNEASKKVNK